MARLDEPLTVEDLARQANMSSRNLARHFNSVTGTTPLQWLLTQRIRRAQELLESSDATVDHRRRGLRHGHGDNVADATFSEPSACPWTRTAARSAQ